MSIAPLPAPLQLLRGRRFAFHPAIRNIEFNEWLCRRATWSEYVMVNTRSGEEILIPRVFLAEISHHAAPVMVVTLHRELEYTAGVVAPRQNRVIQMPVVEREPSSETKGPAQIISIRLETRSESRAGRWLGAALVLGVVAVTVIVDVARQSQPRQRPLTSRDDYGQVVRKLGPPANIRNKRAYRLLDYATRHYSVVLLENRYIGAIDARGRVLDQVRLPDGSTSTHLLQSINTGE